MYKNEAGNHLFFEHFCSTSTGCSKGGSGYENPRWVCGVPNSYDGKMHQVMHVTRPLPEYNQTADPGFCPTDISGVLWTLPTFIRTIEYAQVEITAPSSSWP